MSSLPPWPPALTDAQRALLLLESSAWALAHGFTLLPPTPTPPTPPTGVDPVDPTNPPVAAIAAPLSLLPSPFPRREYERARELQTVYNALYARVALDWAWLDRVMGGVAEVDAFQGELWRRWKGVRGGLVQPLHLAIVRSDYLLHDADGELAIKQVEFNTIAASFGALSQKAGEMHRYLAQTTGYFGASAELADTSAYPANRSLEEIASGLASGWEAYGRRGVVLEVVQGGERNIFDQRNLEYELASRHGVRTVRHTFAELARVAKLDAKGRLVIPDPAQPDAAPLEVAVVYYRAAYTPTDYTSSTEWETRVLLERSAAIKCPSMALQLAGAKKVQQELALPGVLEDFLLRADRPDVGLGAGAGSLTQAAVDAVRATWTGLWPLDDSELGREAQRLARDEAARFVLKPQREGGGNNIYRDDIPPYLAELDKTSRPGEPPKREGYILMELITPPTGVHNWLVRGGEGKARLADVVSELGVYGVAIFGDGKTAVNRQAGTLLRTKGRESDEGGVAIGISSIDSPLLV